MVLIHQSEYDQYSDNGITGQLPFACLVLVKLSNGTNGSTSIILFLH